MSTIDIFWQHFNVFCLSCCHIMGENPTKQKKKSKKQFFSKIFEKFFFPKHIKKMTFWASHEVARKLLEHVKWSNLTKLWYLEDARAFKFFKLSISTKIFWLCLFATDLRLFKLKISFFAQKHVFLFERHKKYKIHHNIINIIRNRLKFVFLLFWGHINEVGWTIRSFLIFWGGFEFWSFWVKNAIFWWFLFWPHPFCGGKQTNYQKIPANYPTYPKSFPKKFWWT